MKIILTGATGFVGQHLLEYSISHPAITSIVVLSRRGLDESQIGGDGGQNQGTKVKVILQQDFESYPDELLKELEGAEGCLWTIGGKASGFPDVPTAYMVNVDFAIAAAKAFADKLAPALKGQGKKFRFVYCSAIGAENDLGKKLWLLKDSRKVKGAAENGLFEISAANSTFDPYMARLGVILPEGRSILGPLVGLFVPWLSTKYLTRAMLELVMNGSDKHVFENDELGKLGKEVSKK